MQRFINMGLIGEGSYGSVFKCQYKSTGQLVAIKKFIDINCDTMVKRTALREIRMLKKLRHENLINLFEVFIENKELYMVLELMDKTILDVLANYVGGIQENTCRRYLWQLLKGVQFIHSQNVIHRDLKPENILISNTDVVKICDFGFARKLSKPWEFYTDYVATRWYRAPELVIGDRKYGRGVDIWAIGCVVGEMLTGEPLFQGDSDIDQLCIITKYIGSLTQRHNEVFMRSPFFIGMELPKVDEVLTLEDMFANKSISEESLSFIKQCLQIDSNNRPTCTDLLKHNLFIEDGFNKTFPLQLKNLFQSEASLAHETPTSESNTNDNYSQSICRSERQGILKKKAKVEREDRRHELRSYKGEPRKKLLKCTSDSLRDKRHSLKSALTTSKRGSKNQTTAVCKHCDCSRVVGENTSCNSSLRFQTLTNDYCQDHDKSVVGCCESTLKFPVICSTATLQVQTKNKVKKMCRLPGRSVSNHNSLYSGPTLQQIPLEKSLIHSKSMRKTHKVVTAGLHNVEEVQTANLLPEIDEKKRDNNEEHRSHAGVSVEDVNINNLRYADDMILIATNEKDLQTLVDTIVHNASDRYLDSRVVEQQYKTQTTNVSTDRSLTRKTKGKNKTRKHEKESEDKGDKKHEKGDEKQTNSSSQLVRYG